jgi:CheY-like chemotaxis protein
LTESPAIRDGTDLANSGLFGARRWRNGACQIRALQIVTDGLAQTHMGTAETSMPPYRDEVSDQQDHLASFNGAHDRPTVLIVEDDDCIAGLLADLLSGEGYRVIVAQDGLEALSAASSERPDMILSDCMMPRLSGTQLATLLRRHPETRTIPIVLMSSTRPLGFNLPEVPFLAKPFEIDDVLGLVAQCIHTPSLARLVGEG